MSAKSDFPLEEGSLYWVKVAFNGHPPVWDVGCFWGNGSWTFASSGTEDDDYEVVDVKVESLKLPL